MDRCRTLLFMPGNNPGMLASAQSLGADIVIFDLEDSVVPAEKDAARILVRHAITDLRPQGAGLAVRVNPLDTRYWQEDLAMIVPCRPDYILLPKTDSRDYVLRAVTFMERLERGQSAGPGPVLLGLVEGALGVENAFAIASSHPRLQGIMLGGEDLTADLGAQRTPQGDELFYARSRVLMACKATGIKAIDTPYPFVNDLDGLEKDAALAVRLGFDGKAAISPHHVQRINAAFAPTPEQFNWALRVMETAEKARALGKGAASLDGMMIDVPIIKRAERILLRAGN